MFVLKHFGEFVASEIADLDIVYLRDSYINTTNWLEDCKFHLASWREIQSLANRYYTFDECFSRITKKLYSVYDCILPIVFGLLIIKKVFSI